MVWQTCALALKTHSAEHWPRLPSAESAQDSALRHASTAIKESPRCSLSADGPHSSLGTKLFFIWMVSGWSCPGELALPRELIPAGFKPLAAGDLFPISREKPPIQPEFLKPSKYRRADSQRQGLNGIIIDTECVSLVIHVFPHLLPIIEYDVFAWFDAEIGPGRNL